MTLILDGVETAAPAPTQNPTFAPPSAPPPPPPRQSWRDRLRHSVNLRHSSGQPLSASARTTNILLIAVAGTIVWILIYAFALSALQEARSQNVLYAHLRQGLAEETIPLSGVAEGSALALIDAPKGGLSNVVVVQGTSSSDLRSGPGHLRNTVIPGQVGTSYLLGRSKMFGGPFSDIGKFKKGDAIKVTDPAGTFTFSVLDVRRAGDPLPQPLASGKARLVLITGETGGITNVGMPSHLVYVDADLKGSARPASTVSTVLPDELALKSQTNSLGSLVLWLQGLVAATVLAAWALYAWGFRQTWLVGVPVILALLWGATSSAALLLPNLT